MAGLVGLGVVMGRSLDRPVQPSGAAKAVHGSHADPVEDAAHERRIVALEREVRSLRAALLQAAPSPGSPSSKDNSNQQPVPLAQLPTVADNADGDRESEVARGEFLDGLSDKLDTEPIDPRWRSDTESEITQVLPDRFGPDVTVDNVACASSICRARVSHPGSPHLPDDKLRAFTTRRGGLLMEMQLDTRQEGVTTLYFLRAPTP